MFSFLCLLFGNIVSLLVEGEPACHFVNPKAKTPADKVTCWVLPQCPQMPSDRCGHNQESSIYDQNRVDLADFWASGYSQVGQDGVLWALFNVLGAGEKYYVEFGVQVGCERNTRWLAERCGWSGLLLDGEFKNSKVNLHQEFVSAANVATLFQKYQVPQDVDLLSIDIDGQDWHVWRALGEAGYRPRVLVIEYGPQLAYPGDWVRPRKDDSPGNTFGNSVDCMEGTQKIKVYSEASSAEAFERLGYVFGYTVVYIHFPDMYFVRNDVLAPHLARFAHLEKGVQWMERRHNPMAPLSYSCTLLLQGHGMLPAAFLLGGSNQSKESFTTLPTSTNATSIIMLNSTNALSTCLEAAITESRIGISILVFVLLASTFCVAGYTLGRKTGDKSGITYMEVTGTDATDQRPDVFGAESDLPS